MHRIALVILLIAFTTFTQARPVDVYFGTGGREAKGIYHATFDTDSGKLSPAILAAELGSPGFLALHPDGTELYAVGIHGEPCVAAYRIGPDGPLTMLNSEPIGDGGAAHVSIHPSGKFLLTAQYGGGSVALFPIAGDGSVEKRSRRED